MDALPTEEGVRMVMEACLECLMCLKQVMTPLIYAELCLMDGRQVGLARMFPFTCFYDVGSVSLHLRTNTEDVVL